MKTGGLQSVGRRREGRFLVRAIIVLFVLGAVLSGCGAEPVAEDERPLVVTTFTVLEDLAARVAGEHLRVVTLAPVGAEIHEWELNPRNFVDLENASLVLYNGYNIEQWMGQARSTAASDVPFVPVAEETGAEPLPIILGDFEGDPDPHLWMNPRIAVQYLEVIRNAFIELDPENTAAYERNTDEAIAELEDLYSELEDTLAVIPDERRVMITSEAAFLYFAEAFDLEHEGIWGTNHEEEGAPDQIKRVIDLVRDSGVGVVFYESTISDRHVRAVAEDTGATVAGPLYVDSVSEPDGEAPDYPAMLRHNARLLAEHLGR